MQLVLATQQRTDDAWFGARIRLCEPIETRVVT